MLRAGLVCGLALAETVSAQAEVTAQDLNRTLAHLSVDPANIFHVRDLRLVRGGVKIYLNDGVLAFASPVNGRTVAAVFTTQGLEAGDAEVLVVPPTKSERKSLADNIKTPVLNDHFGSAVFFFSDGTLKECLSQIDRQDSSLPINENKKFRPLLEPVFLHSAPGLDLNLVQSLLDKHREKDGFFEAAFGGRSLGFFDLLFDPCLPEPVTLGRSESTAQKQSFRLWTSFRPARSLPPSLTASRISNYHLDVKILANLLLSANAEFEISSDEAVGRVLRLELSDHLRVTSASIDGRQAEVLERHDSPKAGDANDAGAFLLVARNSLMPGLHRISVNYVGSVIRRTDAGALFVEERNTWYPHLANTFANFDLEFECPEELSLVATGELVSENVINGTRKIHRRTAIPEGVAGFNLGKYEGTITVAPPYQIDLFAEHPATQKLEDIGAQSASILNSFTRHWGVLPFKSISISPISGYFGQGFPGLIYLSDVAYLRTKDRPPNLRGPLMDAFFSGVLLPHEIAHQWWGNLVFTTDYRTAWITEAMANYSALRYISEQQNPTELSRQLGVYRNNLLAPFDGKTLEATGPVDFGVRLLDSAGKSVWQTIIYEKGSWIMHMLQDRLGDARWLRMQVHLLQEFRTKPLSNEEFRQIAAQYVPSGQPDSDLRLFFDTWVYGTGIPVMSLHRRANGWELEVEGVDDDFSLDVPLQCRGRATFRTETKWVRANAGTNMVLATDDSRSCSLPSPSEFLYVPGHS